MDYKPLIGLASKSIEGPAVLSTPQNWGQEEPWRILLYSSTSSTVYQVELRIADESINGSASSTVGPPSISTYSPLTLRLRFELRSLELEIPLRTRPMSRYRRRLRLWTANA